MECGRAVDLFTSPPAAASSLGDDGLFGVRESFGTGTGINGRRACLCQFFRRRGGLPARGSMDGFVVPIRLADPGVGCNLFVT